MQPLQIEVYPEPVKFHVIPVINFGNVSKKRLRVWPFVLSSPTAGNVVTFTPLVDGIALTLQAETFTVGKERVSYRYQFHSDVFGVDYSGTFTSSSPFEVGQIIQPEVVETLPVAKQFDQIGPQEFFQFGKLIQMEIRLIAFGGTELPYIIYFQDTSQTGGTLEILDGKEGTYYIKFPKTTGGSIVRIELGPVDYDFHKIYSRLQVAKSGDPTELDWVTM